MRREALGTSALGLIGGSLWAVGESGSKVADLGTGILTGVTVAALVLTLERRHASERERMRDAIQETRSRELELIEDRREAERKRLLVQQLLATTTEARGLDLSGVDLGGLPLHGRRFRSCKLRGVQMREGELSGSDFADCDLSGSHFSRTDMRGVRFDDCNLAGVELTVCDVSEARFDDSIMTALRVRSCIDDDVVVDGEPGWGADVIVSD